ncbi:MAG: hypothetical protein ACRC2K_13155 [Clostridium sp.]
MMIKVGDFVYLYDDKEIIYIVEKINYYDCIVQGLCTTNGRKKIPNKLCVNNNNIHKIEEKEKQNNI